jgi:predicted nucleic acid-binding protein
LIVADTNLVAYLLIEGEKTDTARAVWERDSAWRLPTLWRSEFLNVLSTSVRARVLTLYQAHRTWSIATALFSESEVEPAGDDVLETAVEYGLSAYDAQFVVVAADLGVPLVTADKKLAVACPDLVVPFEQFLR